MKFKTTVVKEQGKYVGIRQAGFCLFDALDRKSKLNLFSCPVTVDKDKIKGGK